MADAEPRITVILPTFRRPESLRRAILSVLSQTFPAFQICVYDDASDDDTKEVVAELAKTDSRIKYWCHEQNIGFMANFNYGLKEVNTPFFSFLCDDDLLLPHFFEKAMESLVPNPEVMMYVGLTIVAQDNKVWEIVLEDGPFGYFPPPEGALQMLLTGHFPSLVFRSEIRGSVGIFDGQAGFALDNDLKLRIAAHHPIIISNDPSAIFTRHEGSISTAVSDLKLFWPGYQNMSNKIMSDESLPLDVRLVIRDQINYGLFIDLCTVGERALVSGDSNTVYAVVELLKRVCNKKTRSIVLLGRWKLMELSKPAYSLVRLMRRLFVPIISFRTIRSRRIRLKRQQEQYGKYLQP
jgi:glycosyltransferase involved in cell wall biosynthesis